MLKSPRDDLYTTIITRTLNFRNVFSQNQFN